LLIGKNKQQYRLVETNRMEPLVIGGNIVIPKSTNKFPFLEIKNSISSLNKTEIYYYIFFSITSKNIYVLFSSGIVFNEIELELVKANFLNHLVDIIQKTRLNKKQKIIVCGHSMGCVLSLCTATMIREIDQSFFDSTIMVIGSAPFKYSNTKDTMELRRLPNIKVFVYCLIRKIPDTENAKAFIDCYVVKGPTEYSNYEPITYITDDRLVDDIDTYEKIYKYPVAACQFRHTWENYYYSLVNIYPFEKKQDTGGYNKTRNNNNKKLTMHKRITSKNY
jgi:hypothetical protein